MTERSPSSSMVGLEPSRSSLNGNISLCGMHSHRRGREGYRFQPAVPITHSRVLNDPGVYHVSASCVSRPNKTCQTQYPAHEILALLLPLWKNAVHHRRPDCIFKTEVVISLSVIDTNDQALCHSDFLTAWSSARAAHLIPVVNQVTAFCGLWLLSSDS